MIDNHTFNHVAASGALSAYRRVTINSDGKIAYTGAGARADGTLQTDIDADVPSKAVGAVKQLSYGVHWGTYGSATALAVGDELEQAANGKITKRVAGVCIGKALESASADGDIIRYLPIEQAGEPVTGDGGKVTQATSASTGVTLSKRVGQITTVALTTAAGAEETFTVTNTTVEAQDIVAVSTTYDGAGTPLVGVKAMANGSFKIVITNLHASAAFDAAMTINFRVLKGATDADLA